MRKSLRPEFKKLETLVGEEHSQTLESVEEKSSKMILEAGYTETEFYSLSGEYYMDFSSENPDEWVVKLDPENAQIISGN
jgi:hypothetical protein